VLDVDLLLVPVHLGNHWTCACVDLQRRELRYYDSFQVPASFLPAPNPGLQCSSQARSLVPGRSNRLSHGCGCMQWLQWVSFGAMQGKEAWVMEALRRYVADEARNKLDQELDTSHWPIECAPPSLLRAASCFLRGRNACAVCMRLQMP
jgi:hypothetical protein